MKYLILLLVVVVVVWLMIGRRRRPPDSNKPASSAAPPPPAETPPQAMLACVHCGVHLPQAEAVLDAAGRPYCGEAHRLAGPR